jgi:hypothetical protein
MRRLPFPALIACVALVLVTARAGAQTHEAAAEVLRTSAITEVLGHVGSQVLVGALSAVPDVDSARIAPVIEVRFSADSLIDDATSRFAAAAAAGPFAELRSWLLSDSIRAIEVKGDSAAAARPLEEYANALSENPPSDLLWQLAQRYARAQMAGEFYVRYLVEVQAAAFRVANAATGQDLEIPVPTEPQREGAVQQFAHFAAISFLQRFEALTEAEIIRLIEAYESPSGQWYVAAYRDAVGAALEAAGRSAAEQLK